MEFYLPTRLLSGRHILRQKSSLFRELGRSCLLLTGGNSVKTCGALDETESALRDAGVSFEVFSGITANPSIDVCVRAGRRAAELGVDFVLGVGGGSVLDAAKASALSAANSELDGDGLYAAAELKRALPIALVGTTAGTGSEVTAVAVITDHAGRKHSFRQDDLYATLAFGDPRYTETMPLSLTAATGVDALAHCMESWFCKNANAFSKAAALEGVRLLVPPLQTVAAGKIPSADERDALYEGSVFGGVAISVTATIFPHNLGYYLTEQYGLPHGFACAVFEPELLRHAEKADPAGLRQLCAAAGLSAQELIALIRALTPKLSFRLSQEEIETILPRWKDVNAIRNTVGDLTLEDVRAFWSRLSE